jgi:serine/threonine-protein kinase
MAEQLGAYRIVRKLGEGGMALAYLATSPDGRPVVLKMPLAPSSETSVKLRDEAQAGFRIQSPFVVRTLDFFVDRGRPVLVVEYVEGCALRDLRQKGKAQNPLPAVAVAWIGRAIAEGLAAIHEATDEQGKPLGMLHRDVTASNILIDFTGVPRLIDLGIARSVENQQEKTQAGMIKGTLRFVAPELLLGAGYSAATDLWALGVSLFEAAVGRQMVSGAPVEVFRTLTQGRHMTLRPGEFIEPALHDALQALLCEKDARLRNARAAARMFAAVEQKLAHADPARRTGQVWLAASVPHASPNEDDVDAVLPAHTDNGFDEEALGTLLVPGAAGAGAAVNPARIVIGDTSSGSAPTYRALPAVEINLDEDDAPPAPPVRDDGRLSTLLLARSELAAPEVPSSSAAAARPLLPAADVATPYMAHVPLVPPAVMRAAVPGHPASTTAGIDDGGVFAPAGLAHAPTLQMARVVVPAPQAQAAGPTLQMPASSLSPADEVAVAERAGQGSASPAAANAYPSTSGSTLPRQAVVASSSIAAGPTLQLPATAIAPPSAQAAATLQLPAVSVAPPSAQAAATLQLAAVAIAPPSAQAAATVQLPAVQLPAVQLPAVVVSPSSAHAAPGAPALPVGVQRSPRLPQLQIASPPPAPGDVLPAGAATLVMPAWTPPPATPSSTSSAQPTQQTATNPARNATRNATNPATNASTAPATNPPGDDNRND